jgi:hypothetical protein
MIMHYSIDDQGRVWYGPDPEAVAKAEAAQARMLAALPDFPRFGFYVKTGLAGYGPDLDENDFPATSWESVALELAQELSFMADFNDQGASALADEARTIYDQAREHVQPWRPVRVVAIVTPRSLRERVAERVTDAWRALRGHQPELVPEPEGPDWQGIADTYHDADEADRLADELSTLAANFTNLANADDPAPLYQGRPELRHARIWDLIGEHFPLDVSDNTRLYVWECAEDPGDEPE